MDDQLTLRLSTDLARALERRARERGVPRSQLVREAIQHYLTSAPSAPEQADIWHRLARFQGVAPLDEEAVHAHPLARQIEDRNWRT